MTNATRLAADAPGGSRSRTTRAMTARNIGESRDKTTRMVALRAGMRRGAAGRLHLAYWPAALLIVLGSVLFLMNSGLAQVPPSATEIAAYRGLHAAAAKGDIE